MADSGDAAHEWIAGAFGHRIGQAVRGLAHTGDWPPNLAQGLGPEAEGGLSFGHRYIVDRLRERSHILEPERRPDATLMARRSGRWFDKALDSLEMEPDPAAFANRFRCLLKRVGRDDRPGRYVRLLAVAANGGHRVSPGVADVVFDRTLRLIGGFLWSPVPFRRACALVPAFLAAAMGLAVSRRDTGFLCRAALLLADWARAGGPAAGRLTAAALFGLLTPAFNSLDLPTELAALLDAIEESGVEWEDPGTSPEALAASLPAAGGRLWLRLPNAAAGVLAAARARFVRAGLTEPERANLAAAYASAVGRSPVAMAGPLLLDLFKTLPPVWCCLSTYTHYSRLHLIVAEAAVLAVATDDFAPPAALARRFGADEVWGRRALLPDLREAVIAWGDPAWRTWGPAASSQASAHAA